MSNSNDVQLGTNSVTVNVLNRSLTKQHEGPITTCLTLDTERHLSRAGSFTATFPASDPRTLYVVQKTRILDFYIGGAFEFRGVVESTKISVNNYGMRVVTVRGRCMAAELAEAPVGFLSLESAGSGVSDGPADILAAATTNGGTTWSLDTTNGYATTVTDVYGKFSGESALSALIKVADQIGEHFRFADDGSREVIWMRTDTPSSSAQAIGSAGEAVQLEDNEWAAVIQDFTESRNSFDQITRIYPYGAGNGDARLTLFHTTRTAGSGFSLDKDDNFIANDDAETALGKKIGRYLEFKEIRPISSTTSDLQAASNLLYDAALAHLQRHDEADDRVSYDLSVLKLPSSVTVGKTIRVIYSDDLYSVDDDFIVLGITMSVDSNSSERVYRLTVAAIDTPTEEGEDAIAGSMERGRVFSSYPQLNANSYTTNYTKYVGENQTTQLAEFYVDFGDEVVQLQQVLARFKILQIVSPSQTVGGTTTSTGASSTSSSGASSTSSSGSSSSSTTAAGSSHTHNVPNHEHNIPVDNDPGGSDVRAVYVNVANPQLLLYDGADEGVLNATTSAGSGATTSASESSHTHGMDHTHGIDHTHNIDHTHDIDVGAALSTDFGIFQESAANTMAITDLEYQVNSDGWNDLNTDATSISGSRFELDLTDALQDATSLRQSQDNNTLQVRRKSAGATGKTCMIDLQLKIRNVIQSVAVV